MTWLVAEGVLPLHLAKAHTRAKRLRQWGRPTYRDKDGLSEQTLRPARMSGAQSNSLCPVADGG